jgi:hypothetical protein
MLMNFSRPKSRNSRPWSSTLKGGEPPAPRTFEDWQAEQALDMRTPEQRGISVGSPVMWRRRNGRVIVTERATVIAISDNTLTLLVKDVQERTCDVNVREIASGVAEHPLSSDATRRAPLSNQDKDTQVRLAPQDGMG